MPHADPEAYRQYQAAYYRRHRRRLQAAARRRKRPPEPAEAITPQIEYIDSTRASSEKGCGRGAILAACHRGDLTAIKVAGKWWIARDRRYRRWHPQRASRRPQEP